MSTSFGLWQRWQHFLTATARGNVIRPLSWPGFEAPAHLLRLDVLEAGLREFVHGAGQPAAGDLLRVLDHQALAVVGRRLPLGGRAQALADLAPLWDAHDTPPRAIRSAVEAASVRAAWKGALLAPDTPLRRGDDYAAFVRPWARLRKKTAGAPRGGPSWIALPQWPATGRPDPPRRIPPARRLPRGSRRAPGVPATGGLGLSRRVRPCGCGSGGVEL